MRRLTRRGALLGLAGAVGLGRAALATAAADTDRRLVVVVLRGAMDGLMAVQPYGDRDLAELRPTLLAPFPGQPNGLLDLGGTYGLHPALAALHPLYTGGELAILHAVAGSWRDRSHFAAQDWLEYGATHALDGGWLNRVAGLVPAREGAGTPLAVGPDLPLLLRGRSPASNWLPPQAQRPPADLYAQIAAMHAGDAITGPAIAAGLRERGFSGGVLAGDTLPQDPRAFAALAGAAGKLLAAPDGPRLAAMELDGWDTHRDQVRWIVPPLRHLADGIVALRQGLGDAWARTVVLVFTEFGRTARTNGTGGTDHGTGTVAFVAGGAVAGGTVRGDWPGLSRDGLLEDRDLRPTTDIAAVSKGVLAGHLGLTEAALAVVFPDDRVAPLARLLRPGMDKTGRNG